MKVLCEKILANLERKIVKNCEMTPNQSNLSDLSDLSDLIPIEMNPITAMFAMAIVFDYDLE